MAMMSESSRSVVVSDSSLADYFLRQHCRVATTTLPGFDIGYLGALTKFPQLLV